MRNIILAFYSTNQWTGFYMLGTFVMKELNEAFSSSPDPLIFASIVSELL